MAYRSEFNVVADVPVGVEFRRCRRVVRVDGEDVSEFFQVPDNPVVGEWEKLVEEAVLPGAPDVIVVELQVRRFVVVVE